MAKLQYCPFTGKFFRAYRNGPKPVAPTLTFDGYVRMKVNGKMVFGHRMAFVLMGVPIHGEVDHKNRIRNDNRWINLRDISSTGNKLNVQSTPRLSRNGKFEAHCGDVYLGTFSDELLAHGTMLWYKQQRIKEELYV